MRERGKSRGGGEGREGGGFEFLLPLWPEGEGRRLSQPACSFAQKLERGGFEFPSPFGQKGEGGGFNLPPLLARRERKRGRPPFLV